MKRAAIVIAMAGAALLAASNVQAQVAPPPPGAEEVPNTNLKVLPKDRFKNFGEILPTMQAIRDALGVGCVYCHTYTAPWNPANDFVSDAKPTKEKARVMLKMVQQINQTIRTEIPALDKPASGRQAVGVQCVTCHKGVTIPRELVDIVMDTGNSKGAQAAVAQYRDLRQKFYGGEQYDFTDNTLFLTATRALAANKADDAILYAQTNVEFNPKSARSFQVMSQAYEKKNDKTGAVSALEKAVAINPQMQNQLDALKKK